MSDLTMCKQSGCIKRKNCYRYLAVPDTLPNRQSYSDFKHCAHDYADQWPISGMASPVIRVWRDVDQEILDVK